MEKKKMEIFKINKRQDSIKIDINFIEWLKEIEFGLDKNFDFEYFYDAYNCQIHCLSLGYFYIAWRGAPYFDFRNN